MSCSLSRSVLSLVLFLIASVHQSVCPSVFDMFLLLAVFALLPLPSRPRPGCCMSVLFVYTLAALPGVASWFVCLDLSVRLLWRLYLSLTGPACVLGLDMCYSGQYTGASRLHRSRSLLTMRWWLRGWSLWLDVPLRSFCVRMGSNPV